MNSTFTSRLIVLTLACFTLAGCFTTTLRSGATAAPPTLQYADKWHHGFINGMVEVSGPYDLQAICPQGWAEIRTETSFFNGIVQAITGILYTPQSVTIRCAASPAAGVPASGAL